ncbi:MAG: hypothetical protein WCP98_07915 [Actinomycetes bacterium]
MPLISFMESNPDGVQQLTIAQIVAMSGDGKLREGSDAQRELREFLTIASTGQLSTYATQCLEESFTKSGQVLQDVVNELGRRLEYEVVNGRYQGGQNMVGYDGIWRDPSGQDLVVEVKTTDAYRLALDTVAGYRDRLLASGEITTPCSILIVVGREDTGELEAQVRGSRHAWDIRIIGVASLLKLVEIKESAERQETAEVIRRLLTPVEYTRVDQLIDVVFATTQDVEAAVAAESGVHDESDDQEGEARGPKQLIPRELINETRARAIAAVENRLGVSLVKRTRALYWDPSKRYRVACTVSRMYGDYGSGGFWYAYHLPWHEFLLGGDEARLVLGCVGLGIAFVLPLSVVTEHLDHFNTTVKPDGSGHNYHLRVLESTPGVYELRLSKLGSTLPLADYAVGLPPAKV